jgi:S1-C subfamily serine protease
MKAKSVAGMIGAIFAIVAVAGCGGSPKSGEQVPAYLKIEKSLAIIGFPTGDPQAPFAFGTGFCVYSDARSSYFATNYHVVADSGAPSQHLVLLFPGSADHHYKATVVRYDPDVDLALVQVDVPKVPAVRFSVKDPIPGDHIAIAGFPYISGVVFGGLWGKDATLEHVNPKLQPLLTDGHVNAAQTGSYYLIYDANTDHGNSGGPLFDATTGDIYGVVDAKIDGYQEDEHSPPRAEYNLAIAVSQALPFLDAPPIHVAYDGSLARVLAAHSRFVTWHRFDKAYGDWLHAHGSLQALGARAASGGVAPAALRAQGAAFTTLEEVSLHAMQTAAQTLQKKQSAPVAQAVAALVQAVADSTKVDTALADALDSSDLLSQSHAHDAKVNDAASHIMQEKRS